MKRLDCLDGLRGVLAVYVMVSHAAPFAALPGWLARPLSHGGAGVDVFFILSGLVIVQSLEAFGHRPAPFLVARAARIFPVFLAVFVLAVAVQAVPTGFARMPWIAADSPARAIWAEGWPHAWPAHIVTHLTMTHGLLPDAILPDAWVSVLGAAWSLSTEWQFYLLITLLGRRLTVRRLAALFLALAALGVVWQAVAPDEWRFSRAFLPNKAQFFALGMASAVLVREGAAGRRCYVTVLLCALLLCWQAGRADKLLPPLVWSLCLAAQLGVPALRPLAAVLRGRALLWLGAISYCVYLVNEPVQKLLGAGLAAAAGGDPTRFTLAWLPAAIVLPIVVAWGLHVTIEAPALRRGRALARRLACGMGTDSHGGRESRAPPIMAVHRPRPAADGAVSHPPSAI